MEAETPAPTAPPGPRVAVEKLLSDMRAMYERGELASLVVGFVKTDGGAAIQSTPMSPVMLNHLSTLLERRVAREYDRALAQANNARGGTGAGAVPESARQAAIAKLPRKVRREVEKARKKLHDKNQRKLAAAPIIRRTPPVS